MFKAEPFSKLLLNKIIIRFDHEFGAHGEISNILEGVGHPGHQPQEAGQEVRFPRATCENLGPILQSSFQSDWPVDSSIVPSTALLRSYFLQVNLHKKKVALTHL